MLPPNSGYPGSAPIGGFGGFGRKGQPAWLIGPHGHTTARVARRPALSARSSSCASRLVVASSGLVTNSVFRRARYVRFWRRRQMPYLRDCDPLTGTVIRASKTTAVRYERDRPGELIHMDVKKIGRIPEGGGWKAHGPQMSRTSAAKKARTGFDYVHSVVDDHSRLAYSEILPDEKDITCTAFLQRAADYFATYGITQIERIMTDNAWAYRKSLREITAALGARQVFIRPHCPWQNGKVERYNRTLQSEWAYREVFTTNDARCAALAPWLEHYNNQRRHSAIGGQPPTSQLSPT